MGHLYRLSETSLPPHLGGLVAACLGVDDLRELRAAVLAALAARVGFDDGHYLAFDGAFFEEAPDYLRTFAADPAHARDLRPALAKTVDRGAYIDTEVFTPRERDRLRVYAELLRPVGITGQLVALVRRGEDVLGVLHLNRRGASRPFVASDREEVEAALPVVALLHRAIAPRTGTSEPLRRIVGKLTPRQLDIALLVAEGYQNAQVAARLGLGDQTVRNQMSNIFARIGVYSRAELALLCERAGLLTPSDREPLVRLARSAAIVLQAG